MSDIIAAFNETTTTASGTTTTSGTAATYAPLIAQRDGRCPLTSQPIIAHHTPITFNATHQLYVHADPIILTPGWTAIFRERRYVDSNETSHPADVATADIRDAARRLSERLARLQAAGYEVSSTTRDNGRLGRIFICLRKGRYAVILGLIQLPPPVEDDTTKAEAARPTGPMIQSTPRIDAAASASPSRVAPSRDRDADFGHRSSPSSPPATPARPATRCVTDGVYTVVRDGASHRTYRIESFEDPSHSFHGKTILSFLAGPNNERDYHGCAFLDPFTGNLKVWRRYTREFTDADVALDFEADLRADVAALLQDPAAAGERYALASGRCYHCDRRLTVPASLHRGLGPICAQKLGVD